MSIRKISIRIFLAITLLSVGCGSSSLPLSPASTALDNSASSSVPSVSAPVEPSPNEVTHIWIKPYTRTDGVFVEGHWRKKTDAELQAVRRASQEARTNEVKIVSAPIQYSGKTSSTSRGSKESDSEKAYEAANGVEVVHKKDGSTYERKQRKKK